MSRPAVLLALLALATLAPACQAQGLERLHFTLQPATMPILPADGTPATVSVPWSITCTQPAPAPEGGLPAQAPRIALSSDHAELKSQQGDVAVPDCATRPSTSGTLTLGMAAKPGAPGEQALPAQLTVTVPGPAGDLVAKLDLEVQVRWRGTVTATAPVHVAAAGPQKQAGFTIHLHVEANAATQVIFGLAGVPKTGWSPIPPVPVLFAPGASDMNVVFLVSTPHHDGGNFGSTNLTLLVGGGSVRDPSLKVPEQRLEFTAKVSGLYVPGPSLGLLLAGLAAGALAAGRRKA